jgi:hypothetical protein
MFGDSNGASDIFVRDRQTGTTERVSVDSTGSQALGSSDSPSISGDGRFVAFVSTASNLVAQDTNGWADVFIHDRQTGLTTRANVDSNGAQANDYSWHPKISADGRYVTFASFATTLVANDANASGADVFAHNRLTGATSLVSLGTAGQQSATGSDSPAVSGNGRYYAFVTLDPFVSFDSNSVADVYVRDSFVPWATLGGGLSGTHGVPNFVGSGTVLANTVITLTLTNALEQASTLLVVGFSQLNAHFKGGTLVPQPSLLFAIPTDATGSVLFPAFWPPGVPSGAKLWLQYWVLDPAGPKGYAASNGLALTTP